VIGAALFVLACDEPPKPRAVDAQSPLQGLKRLALVPPGGTGEVDREIEKLQSMAKSNPAKVDTWVVLGRAFVRKARQANDPGFYANANACADVALDLKPQYTLGLGLKGLALMNDHRFQEARELAESVLAQDRDDLMALGVLSDALLELGDFEASAEAAQRMMDLKPNLPSYTRAAYIKWLRGDVEGAKHSYRLAMDAGAYDQRDPEPGAWVISEAAKMFFMLGDYEGAEVGFDRALKHFADFPPALLGKARAALALGRNAEAAALAKKSFERSGLAEAAWVWGDAARAANDFAQASQAYADVVRIGRQGDKKVLAAFYATEDRELPEALKLIETELKTRGDIYTHDAHAWVLYRLGRYAEAKIAIGRATRLGTKDPVLLYHAGAIDVATGEVEKGLAKIKEALATSPSFHPFAAPEASAMISRL
jgi:tetratricopeptide (TPR) repeat protein